MASSATDGIRIGDQLPGPVQPGQAPAVAAVGLDPIAGRGRDQRRGDHLARHAQGAQQPSQLVAGRPSLITRPQPPRRPQPGDQTTNRIIIRGDLLDIRDVMARPQDATEMVFL
jgi:hypothetical protein